jgi:hypothetical protein
LQTDSAAMNMAWTPDATSTSFRAINPQLLVKRSSMKKTIHIPAAATALILSLAAGSLAHAQSGPTPQEQMACRSDAGKFRSEHIGKPPQMNACLEANKQKLSDGCRKVVESRGG